MVFVGPRYTTSTDDDGYDDYDNYDNYDGYDGSALYPNPIMETLTIRDGVRVGNEVHCIDVLGVVRIITVVESRIDVRLLPVGMYFLVDSHGRRLGRFVKISN